MYLSSRSNSQIKYIRSLHQKKVRDQENRFLIEGMRLVEEALALRWPLALVVRREGAPFLSLPPDLPQIEVPEALMSFLTTLASAPEYLAVAVQTPVQTPALTRACFLLTAPLQDPRNLGALLRLADALALRGVWVLGQGVDLYHPRVLRGAMGSALRIPVRVLDSLTPLWALKSAGWSFLAAAARGQLSSFQVAFPERTVLMLGSEGAGLPASLLAMADSTLAIPIAPQVESLNVVTAAAMLLHEYARQYPLEGVAL
jgi:TrmH family RNA methyltransferase